MWPTTSSTDRTVGASAGNRPEAPRIRWRNLAAYLLIFILAPIVSFVVGNWLDAKLSLPRFPAFPINLFLGIIVFFSGLSLGINSTRLLYSKGLGLPWGELNHAARSSRLVTSGPYAYSRNPIVLGYSLLPCGMGIMFQSLSIVITITAVVLFLAVLLLKVREEPSLEKRFGTEYFEYKRRTPLLVPSPTVLLSLLKRQLLGGDIRTASYRSLSRLALASLSISLFGLYLLSVMAFNSTDSGVQSFGQKLLPLFFTGICVFGVVAGLSPSKLVGLSLCGSSRETGRRKALKGDRLPVPLGGHHPACERFSSHVLRLKGRVFCAGCSGLVAGALVSVAGSLACLLVGFKGGDALFKLGVAFILCGLLQHSIIDSKNAVVHCVLNFLFVAGTFLALIGLVGINSNLSVGLYFLLLTANLIATRIMLSRLVHSKTCAGCVDRCAAAFV